MPFVSFCTRGDWRLGRATQGLQWRKTRTVRAIRISDLYVDISVDSRLYTMSLWRGTTHECGSFPCVPHGRFGMWRTRGFPYPASVARIFGIKWLVEYWGDPSSQSSSSVLTRWVALNSGRGPVTYYSQCSRISSTSSLTLSPIMRTTSISTIVCLVLAGLAVATPVAQLDAREP